MRVDLVLQRASFYPCRSSKLEACLRLLRAQLRFYSYSHLPPSPRTTQRKTGSSCSTAKPRRLGDQEVFSPGSLLGENYANTFRVENGVLKISLTTQYSDFGNRFGHIFYRDRKFSHYVVAAEYRFVGEQVKGGPGPGFRTTA